MHQSNNCPNDRVPCGFCSPLHWTQETQNLLQKLLKLFPASRKCLESKGHLPSLGLLEENRFVNTSLLDCVLESES
jgi:hypothetical protein